MRSARAYLSTPVWSTAGVHSWRQLLFVQGSYCSEFQYFAKVKKKEYPLVPPLVPAREPQRGDRSTTCTVNVIK